MCHQKFREVDNPPRASKELLPKIEADGVLGIRKAIGVSNLIGKFGCSASEKR
jgi:hypothetical protein